MARNFRNIRKPSFAHLLAAASFVEIDDEIGIFGIEIGWRIVEGEMTVLADADKRNIDWRRPQRVANLTDDFARIGLPVEQMIVRDASLLNQPFEKIFAKAGGMSNGQADVFIEVKHLDALPVDIGDVARASKKSS